MSLVYFSLLEAALIDNVSYQYSYDKHCPNMCIPKEYFSFNGSGVTVNLYEGDLPFKERTNTFPRTEMRFLDQYGTGSYRFEVDVDFLSIPIDMQFSWFQLFASNPGIMLRFRNGESQFVAFHSKYKINKIDFVPSGHHHFSVEVKDGRDGYAKLGIDGVDILSVPCKWKFRNKLHVKLGPYAQQMDPVGLTSIRYHNLSIHKL